MNEWTVYSKTKVNIGALGTYLAIKYFAGLMSVIYVDDVGDIRTALSQDVILVRPQTGPDLRASKDAPRRKS